MSKGDLPSLGLKVTIWLKSGRGEAGLLFEITDTRLTLKLHDSVFLRADIDSIEAVWWDTAQ